MVNMPKKRILIVEDEADMADLVAMRLRREGFLPEVAHNGREALEKVRADPPDLVVLDLMLPGISGTEVATELRHDPRTANVPIIMLTAKGEEADVIVGLQLGADDYVTKPCSLSVLVARIVAVLRRSVPEGAASHGPLTLGRMRIDPDQHQVRVAGRPVKLTRTEFRILLALATARGRVLSRYQLVDQAMGPSTIVTDRTIDVHVAALRRKLGPARRYIQTVRGVGYRLDTEAVESDETA
jgi:two-component system phosphate regulon response regulator PhoB